MEDRSQKEEKKVRRGKGRGQKSGEIKLFVICYLMGKGGDDTPIEHPGREPQ
jgi:hypothetical protein